MTAAEMIRNAVSVNPEVSSKELSEALGCSRGHVTNIRCGRDCKPRKGRRYFTNRLKHKAAFYWGKDIGAPEIAKELNVQLNQVIKFLQDENLLDA